MTKREIQKLDRSGGAGEEMRKDAVANLRVKLDYARQHINRMLDGIAALPDECAASRNSNIGVS